MNPRMTKLSIALMQVLGVGLAAGVVALPAMAQQPAARERIEVTGSNINRVEGENALPVTVIPREEIQNSGVHTLQDILGQLPRPMSFGRCDEAGVEASLLAGLRGA